LEALPAGAVSIPRWPRSRRGIGGSD